MSVKCLGPGEFLVQSEDGPRSFTIRASRSDGVRVTNRYGDVLDPDGEQFAEVVAAMTSYTEQQRVDAAKLIEIRDQIGSGQ